MTTLGVTARVVEAELESIARQAPARVTLPRCRRRARALAEAAGVRCGYAIERAKWARTRYEEVAFTNLAVKLSTLAWRAAWKSYEYMSARRAAPPRRGTYGD